MAHQPCSNFWPIVCKTDEKPLILRKIIKLTPRKGSSNIETTMMTKFSLFIPTRFIFGTGELRQLSKIKLPGKRALIVISSGGSMRKHGYVDAVKEQLWSAGVACEVFDKVLPNPIRKHVMEGAKMCRESQCDFVIGLGGGSSIDTAKAIAVMACNEGDLWDYIPSGSGKGQPFDHALPIVAIPTTAGTGTEIDPWAVITHEDLQEKVSFGFEQTIPQIAIVDPVMMLSLPPKLTAYQGFDAFFHAAEGYINRTCHTPISDLYALEAIRLLYKYLPVVVADGSDVHARCKVAWASSLAGMVETTSRTTGQHALANAMSGFYPKLPHGAALIALSQTYFKTFKNDSMKRYMKMAEKMTMQKAARPSDFLDALAIMQRECNVDKIKLSEWGITPADFSRFTECAIATGGTKFDYDPRFLNKEELIDIYYQAYR